MRQKRMIVGILAAGLTLAAAVAAPEYPKIESSAHSFQQYFQAMQGTGDSLGPVERFVFSLILANFKTSHTGKPATVPEHRT
jgi:hypothetical protein